nr:hypothetical protein [Actinomycetota bacterium]
LELIAAGATAVALGTILFSEPEAPTRIRGELAAEAATRNLPHPLAAARVALGSVRETIVTTGNELEKALQIPEKRLT